MPGCLVPAEIVVPIIQRYLDSYETHGDYRTGQVTRLSPHTFLAEKAGLRPDTVAKYLTGRTRMLSFYTVDRLLCAMDQSARWHEWPLMVFYLAADLSDPPPGFRLCAREGCEVEFRVTDYPSNKSRHKFCSHECATGDAHGHVMRQSFCRNHHPRTPENTQWRRSPTKGLYRTCLVCIRARESERVREKVAA